MFACSYLFIYTVFALILLPGFSYSSFVIGQAVVMLAVSQVCVCLCLFIFYFSIRFMIHFHAWVHQALHDAHIHERVHLGTITMSI